MKASVVCYRSFKNSSETLQTERAIIDKNSIGVQLQVWEDIVCKYWKWAKKVGGVEGSGMKPALSVMHAKAHNWTCQVYCRFIARLQFCLLVSVDVSYQYRR